MIERHFTYTYIRILMRSRCNVTYYYYYYYLFVYLFIYLFIHIKWNRHYIHFELVCFIRLLENLLFISNGLCDSGSHLKVYMNTSGNLQNVEKIL